MMDQTLRADCARCAALCCVAFAFETSAEFGFSKPAMTPCRNLAACGTCRIHAGLAQQGFSGCAQYDCWGAGSYVTQTLFAGRQWQEEPELMAPMAAAFLDLAPIHVLLMLLAAARRLPLDEAEAQSCARLEAGLQPPAGWTQDGLRAFDRRRAEAEVHAFLTGLARHLPPEVVVARRGVRRPPEAPWPRR